MTRTPEEIAAFNAGFSAGLDAAVDALKYALTLYPTISLANALTEFREGVQMAREAGDAP